MNQKIKDMSFVKGEVLVKARKIGEIGNDYYLEFNLTKEQVSQLTAQLMVDLVSNNHLTVIHNHPLEYVKAKEWIGILNDTIAKYPDMSDEIKQKYYGRILELSGFVETTKITDHNQ